MNTTLDTSLIGPDRVLDVRDIPCSIKHGLIIRTWLAMPVGQHFILVNGHDPVPLFYQFSAEWPNTFTWEHVLKQAEEVRVKITKLKATQQAESPGHCCPTYHAMGYHQSTGRPECE